MEKIISVQNQQVKQLRKLKKHQERIRQNSYLVEGFHLVNEANQAGQQLIKIIYTDSGEKKYSDFLAKFDDSQKMLVSCEVIASLSDLTTPSGIMAVVSLPSHKKNKNAEKINLTGKWLYLAGVQDPGNVGTMIRTADATGFSGVVLGTGTADIYNSKVLRAMQGSNFHLQIKKVSESDLLMIEQFRNSGMVIFGTEVSYQAQDFRQITPPENFVLLMGNEGNGLAPELLAVTDVNLYVPMKGRAESLNVSVAAGILMYQLC